MLLEKIIRILLNDDENSYKFSGAFGTIKKGALRAMFKYPADKPLPAGWACRAKNIPIGGTVTLNGVSRRMTPLLKRRIVFACNAETKFSHR